jgi:uncharacterized protein (DUF433 family)
MGVGEERHPVQPVLYQDRITTDPEIMGGKPVVKGTRIPVELVLEELAANPDLNVLLAAHPALTLDDVRACLGYARALVSGERVAAAPPRLEWISKPMHAPFDWADDDALDAVLARDDLEKLAGAPGEDADEDAAGR